MLEEAGENIAAECLNVGDPEVRAVVGPSEAVVVVAALVSHLVELLEEGSNGLGRHGGRWMRCGSAASKQCLDENEAGAEQQQQQ